MRALLKGAYRGWMVFAHGLGRIQTLLILSIFYLVVVGAISLVYRVFVGDPLQQRNVNGGSDWVRKPRTNLSLSEARQIF
jgi:saxitoxin biosynthesis operon SxtJ-like protein